MDTTIKFLSLETASTREISASLGTIFLEC